MARNPKNVKKMQKRYKKQQNPISYCFYFYISKTKMKVVMLPNILNLLWYFYNKFWSSTGSSCRKIPSQAILKAFRAQNFSFRTEGSVSARMRLANDRISIDFRTDVIFFRRQKFQQISEVRPPVFLNTGIV